MRHEERTEIWKALINLEYYFGGDDEELRDLYLKAMNANEKIVIQKHLMMLFKKNKDMEKGEKYSEIFLKKANSKEEAWITYLEFLLETRYNILPEQIKTNAIEVENEEEEQNENMEHVEEIEEKFKEQIKSVLRRSLQSLPSHKHVNFLTKYAVLEYRFGNIEVGRTNFENLVSEYPNKLDIWKVYLDMEIKYFNGEHESVRNLFDKILNIKKLKMRLAKTVFKKYIEFETKFGNNKRIAKVKQMAMNFVEKRSKNGEEENEEIEDIQDEDN